MKDSVINPVDFTYKTQRILGLNCPAKTLLIINNIPVCFCNSNQAVEPIIKYASTLDESVLENNKIKRTVRTILGVNAERN